MAEKDKKFYWLKLKSEFMNGEIVDFLMSQKNGANYVVLYQMLALKTMNTQGKLCSEMGEVIIPFDPEKIQRECKWFDIDTVRVAMELYAKLGLVYRTQDGLLQIANYEELVGSETYWANRKRIERQEMKQIGQCPTNVQDNVQKTLISNSLSNSNSIINNNKDIAISVLEYLNEQAGTHFKPIESNLKFINARLKDYTEDDLKAVVDKKVNDWKGGEMQMYLRPETLFNATKFETYHNGLEDRKGLKDYERKYSRKEMNANFQKIEDIEI